MEIGASLRIVTVALCLPLSFAATLELGGAPSPLREQIPVFRSGVRLVAIDVTVLDRDRHPVRGLTPLDFAVAEDGVLQPISFLTEINVPGPDATAAPWTRETGSDVVTNSLDARRLVAIVMNDGETSPESTLRARAIAHAVIDQLGPSDVAAVMHTYLGRAENFTSDRLKLRAAVDSFVGQPGPPLACALKLTKTCGPDVLKRVADIVGVGAPGRKIVAYIGPTLRLSGDDGDIFDALGPMGAVLRSLQAANATVYEFDPSGLLVRLGRQPEVGLAESTGGRAVRDTNNPDRLVPAAFAESSSYYLLGYESTRATADGKYRRIHVTVGRSGAEVISRSGYFAQTAPDARVRSVPVMAPEDAALARGLPSGDLPIDVSAAAFASPNRRSGDVVAVLRLREPPAGPSPAETTRRSRRVTAVMAAFDTGWRERGRHRQTFELELRPGADRASAYEVASRLSLPPGRYELRFAAEREGVAGSAFVTLDVPNFLEERLSLSGLLVERMPRPRPLVGSNLAADLSVTPTAERIFSATDRVSVFARVYQGGVRAPQPVTMLTTIRNSRDVEVHRHTRVIQPGEFGVIRTADHRAALSIADMPPGEYLVTLSVSEGDQMIGRSVRISVQP